MAVLRSYDARLPRAWVLAALVARRLCAVTAAPIHREDPMHVALFLVRSDSGRRGDRMGGGLDVDVLDPVEGRMNEFAASAGLSLQDLKWCLMQIAGTEPIRAASVTAYDPAADATGRATALSWVPFSPWWQQSHLLVPKRDAVRGLPKPNGEVCGDARRWSIPERTVSPTALIRGWTSETRATRVTLLPISAAESEQSNLRKPVNAWRL